MFKEVARNDTRILRNCIIGIKDIYLCSSGILQFTLKELYTDFMVGDVDETLLKCLNKVYDDMHEEFECFVADELKSNFTNALVKSDIKKEGMKVGSVSVPLPGQLDVLMLYNNKIFVIECKTVHIKITSKSMANTLSRFRKTGKGSFQTKLKDKIECINLYKEQAVKFIGDDYSKYVDSYPIGIFAISSHNLACLDKTFLYPVVTWTDLCKWITDNYGE